MLLDHKEHLHRFKCYPVLTLDNFSSDSADMFLQLVTTDIAAPAWISAWLWQCTDTEDRNCLFRAQQVQLSLMQGCQRSAIGVVAENLWSVPSDVCSESNLKVFCWVLPQKKTYKDIMLIWRLFCAFLGWGQKSLCTKANKVPTYALQWAVLLGIDLCSRAWGEVLRREVLLLFYWESFPGKTRKFWISMKLSKEICSSLS